MTRTKIKRRKTKKNRQQQTRIHHIPGTEYTELQAKEDRKTIERDNIDPPVDFTIGTPATPFVRLC